MRRAASLLLLACLTPVGLHAQSSLETQCAQPPSVARFSNCVLTVQAVEAAQSTIGFLAAGGAPITGGPGSSGFRLGTLPGVSAGLRWNVLSVGLPDIMRGESPEDEGSELSAIGGYLPTLNGEISVELNDGFTARPGIGGIGALRLLGSFSYLPLSLFDADSFRDTHYGFGLGVRASLLKESFTVPGISLSVVRRTTGEIRMGDVCNAPEVESWTEPSGQPAVRSCGVPTKDGGEAAFDLTNWSTRIAVGKHLRGFGVSGGIGHDSYRSDVKTAASRMASHDDFLEYPSVDFSANRWSVFGDVSYTLLIGTIALEAGWQQGGSPVAGFEQTASTFNPRAGSWFGSLSGRVAL